MADRLARREACEQTMDNDVKIRTAVREDFERIRAFDRWGGDRRKEIEQGVVFVAERGEEILGYITLDTSFYERPFLRYLYIRSDHRRKGIGEQFMDFIESKCRGKRVFSSTESDNLAMLLLFEKKGYKLSGWIENLQERAEVVFCKDVP